MHSDGGYNHHYHHEGRMDTLTTGQVAAQLGTSEPRLQELIRHGKVPRPCKVRGKRVWSKKDVENARRALENGR